jgi:tetratricopeptide (TPR) repeat protein
MSDSPTTRALHRWEIAGLIAFSVIVLTIPLSLLRRSPTASANAEALPDFVGSAACRDCHQIAFERWLGSDHDLAMAEATEETVRGDFDDAEFTHLGITSRFYRREAGFYVWTEGPGGEIAEFEVTHTFGHDPLQQYLARFPNGRLQALSIAWDTLRERWFHLYPDQDIPPDDWLHWTRNAQNWNGMCAECHSTNLRKGYDPTTESYTTTWSDIDVGCEACHGPGSRHVAWASIQPMARPEMADFGLVSSTRDIEPEQLVELCAPCHSRRAELGDYDHTALQLLDHMLPSLLREGLYHADGQILDEVYVYGSFVQSKMYARDVSCWDCHDSHSLELLREGNELCFQCHQPEVYDSSDHHFHKKIHQGKASDGALCVKCHMPEQPYMVIDWRADHSFRVPRPELSIEVGTPNACSQGGCHDDRPLRWSADAYRKWYGQARRPHFGTTFAAARAGDPGVADQLIRIVESTLQPPMVRATALELLQRYPSSEAAANATRAALSADDALIRHTAVSSIVVGDSSDRAELLAPLLSDPVKAVRLSALSQLAGASRETLKSYQQSAFDQALEEYLDAAAYSLDFAHSGLNLGNLHAKLGQRLEAERYYRLALKIDDLFYPAKLNLAVLLSGQGRNSEAAVLLREVLEAFPDNVDAAYSLGLLRVEMGDAEEGLRLLRRASELMPRDARVHYNLGLLLQQLGRVDEARLELDTASALEPTNLEFLYALADHYLKRGQLDAALEIADRMIAAHPEEQVGHEVKAYIERARADVGDPDARGVKPAPTGHWKAP